MPESQETIEEIARRWDEIIESGRDLEGLVRVDVNVHKPVGTAFVTRYSADEAKLIRDAAAQSGMTELEFIRAAALAGAAGELDLASAAKASEWQKIRKIARELSEAVELHSEAENPTKTPRKRKAS